MKYCVCPLKTSVPNPKRLTLIEDTLTPESHKRVNAKLLEFGPRIGLYMMGFVRRT